MDLKEEMMNNLLLFNISKLQVKEIGKKKENMYLIIGVVYQLIVIMYGVFVLKIHGLQTFI